MSAAYDVKVETIGSFWLISEARGQYMRMPKEEKPRDDGPIPELMRDLEWHPLSEWRITDDTDEHWSPGFEGPWLLVYPPGQVFISAAEARIVEDRR